MHSMNSLTPLSPQLREEKIELENVLEAESESHVNRLSRELSALRLAQQQQQQQQQAGPSHVNGSGSGSPQDTRTAPQLAHLLSRSNGDPSQDMILDALRRENEALRGRLVETEQDFIRISRLNEVYREELIQHRRRVSHYVRFTTTCPTFSRSSVCLWTASSGYLNPSRSPNHCTAGRAPAAPLQVPFTSLPIPRIPSDMRPPSRSLVHPLKFAAPQTSSRPNPQPLSPTLRLLQAPPRFRSLPSPHPHSPRATPAQ